MRALARSFAYLSLMTLATACDSPEMGRERGGGHGGDGGNYSTGGIHVPSKLDGTKTWTARPET